MRFFSSTYFKKSVIVALLIGGIALLCPINPLPALAAVSNEATLVSLSTHGAGMGDINGSQTHVQSGDHVADFLLPLNYLAFIFLAVLVFLAFLSIAPSILLVGDYLTKLKYFCFRYRVIIKPKLETAFLRWLNLLGGAIAFSF